jgi:spore coat protein U-like protein
LPIYKTTPAGEPGPAPKEEEGMKKVLMAVVAVAVVAMAGNAMAGGSATVAVSATVAGNCKFLSNGTVTFTLDPSSTGNASGVVVQPTFWCTKGTSYAITDDKGLNESGTTYQMKNTASAELIPYSFSYTSTGTGGGRGATLTMDISALVANANFINASAGDYADTVTLTINP